MADMDWVGWHAAYDDPESSLSLRLGVVRKRVGEALDAAGPRRRRVLSLCAGDGRDLLPELAARPGAADAALLIELDPTLAERSRQRVADLELSGVEVRTADAGHTDSFVDHAPVDLLLLCGIFGNVEDADIKATIEAVPALVSPGGFVVWTRGWFEHGDLRPVIRGWCAAVGLIEIAYDEQATGFGIGFHGVPRGLSAAALPSRLFTFIR